MDTVFQAFLHINFICSLSISFYFSFNLSAISYSLSIYAFLNNLPLVSPHNFFSAHVFAL